MVAALDRPTGAGTVDRLSFAVVMPSRGLVNSRTVEAVISNIASAGYLEFRGWFVSHDKPMPLGHEAVTEDAMASGADLLWFCEDDVIPPSDALASSLAFMVRANVDVAAIDYPVGAAQDAWGCIVREASGEILWCGLGCTLMAREVFESLGAPWFTTDWRYVRDGEGWKAIPAMGPEETRFGQFDIHLCYRLREAGFRIGQVEGMMARHARIEALGREGTNVGCHRISIRDRIERPWPGPTS